MLANKSSKKSDTSATAAAEKVARLTNPVILSVLFLVVISAIRAPGLADWIEWGAVMLSFLVIFPLVYVHLRFFKNGNQPIYKTDPTRILKYKPRDIIFLGLIFGLPCLLFLIFLKMPLDIICLLTALLVTAVLVAFFNLFQRVSFHLAAVSVLIIMAVVIWGNYWLFSLALLPVIGWAKIRLGDHNLFQLLAGAVLAAGASTVALLIFGIL